MSLDTLLEEDQLARAEQQIGGASDAQLAQMGGRQAPQDDYTPPDWSQGAMGVQVAPDAPIPTAQDAGAPPPLPPPEAAPQTPVDLLAQVQAGQISRPAIDKAFGPPPTPAPEPQQGAQGLDWRGIADRLGHARGQGHQARMGNMLLTAGTLGGGFHPVDDEASRVAGAEDELKLGQAKHAMGAQDAQEADRKAGQQRAAAGDDWRQLHERMQLTQQAQQAADRLKAEQALRQMNGEEKAVADQHAEQVLAETARAHDLEHSDRQAALDARGKRLGGVSPKAKAAEAKAAKTATNVGTMVDGIYEGTIDPADLGSRSNEFKQDFETAMAEKHPGFSMSKAGMLFNQLREYGDAKPGSAGATLQATKTAYDHLKLMQEKYKNLHNTDSRTLNAFRQAFAKELGFDDVSKALGEVQAGNVTTGSELATTYNHATEGGHKAYESILDPKTPPEVAEAQFQMILKQMDERMHEREVPLRRYAQSPGHHKLIDELGLSRPSTGDGGAPSGDKEGDEKPLPSGAIAIYRNGKWVKK